MRKILLLEPNYKNKYPPMGLMKLATYYRERGEDVRFFKGDLKNFAVTLLLEEYLFEVEDATLIKNFPKLFEYIKTGKYAPIESIQNFKESANGSLLKQYRKKYVAEEYPRFDIICITTLFTFYWKKTIETINFAKKFLTKKGKIIVGGISSSILPNKIFDETGIKPVVGQLDKPGILDADSNVIIDELPLDYSILEEIDYKYPANNAYFAYMTRGCPNRCAFCAVPKLEPIYCNYISLKPQLDKANLIFGAQKDLLLMDNNVLASNCFDKIVDEIKECGFERGAVYIPPNEYEIVINNLKENRNIRAYTKKMIEIYDRITEKLPEGEQGNFYSKRKHANLLYSLYATTEAILEFDKIAHPLYNKLFKFRSRRRYVDFNQGVDSRFMTEAKMKKISEINIRPLRIAFDHYSMKDKYIKAVKMASKYDIRNLSNYLLYNFKDTPEELFYRMQLNIDLCEQLDVKIYSFPMKYHPIDEPNYFNNREYIGMYWNRKFIRSIQSVLNSTKGKVGKGRPFFEEAFGKDIEDFKKILWMPETFIIHRTKYKNNLTAEWWEKFNALNDKQSNKIKSIIKNNHFTDKYYNIRDKKILEVLEYYKIKYEQ
jgi:2-methylthioadenine synthetase